MKKALMLEIRNAQIKAATDKGATLETYKTMTILKDYQNEERPTIKIWRGNAKNHSVNYYFRNIDKADKYLQQQKESEDLREGWAKERADKRKAEKAAINNQNIELRTIFYTSWGYDQTNVDYYQVVGRKGKQTLIVKEISKEYTESGFMSGHSKAIKDSFINDTEIEVRMSSKNSFNIKGRYHANLWDGKEKYESSYA